MVYRRSDRSQAVSMVYRSGKDSLAWNYVDSLIWVWDNLWRHFLSGILKYGWLDPSSWVYRQSNWHNRFGSLIKDCFGDDDSLVVGSYLCKSSPRCRIVEISKVKGGSFKSKRGLTCWFILNALNPHAFLDKNWQFGLLELRAWFVKNEEFNCYFSRLFAINFLDF